MAGEERIIPEKIGSEYFLRGPESGELIRLKGYGSMKGMLDFDPDIDLTKPIWEQVQAKEKAQRKKASKSKTKAA